MNVHEADLCAARSEDARVRLVHAFMTDAKALLEKQATSAFRGRR
jgi:hypothetical protein